MFLNPNVRLWGHEIPDGAMHIDKENVIHKYSSEKNLFIRTNIVIIVLDPATKDCNCEYTKEDPEDISEMLCHYARRCQKCLEFNWSSFCPHNLTQRPCHTCGETLQCVLKKGDIK